MMKIGDKIRRKISFGAEYSSSQPIREGVVVYIHPERRFYTLEFTFRKGGTVRKFRESYPMKNRITQPRFESEGKQGNGPRLPGEVPERRKEKKGKYLNHI